MGPILALVLFNSVVFVIVINVLLKHFRRRIADLDKKAQAMSALKTLISVISIMFMFGMQWLFGAFTIADASKPFQWLFVIFSTLQGVFLFIFFVALNQEAREEWLNIFSFGHRKKPRHTSISQATRPNRNNRSTYSTSKRDTSYRTFSLSSAGDSAVEMKEYRKKLFMAPPTSVSQETEFVIENDAADHESHHSSIEEIHKVDLASEENHDQNVDLASEEIEKVDLASEGMDDSSNKPSIEVPEHILQRRSTFSSSRPRDQPSMEVPEEVLQRRSSFHQPSFKESEEILQRRFMFQYSRLCEQPLMEVPEHILQRRAVVSPLTTTAKKGASKFEEEDFENTITECSSVCTTDFGDLTDFSLSLASDTEQLL